MAPPGRERPWSLPELLRVLEADARDRRPRGPEHVGGKPPAQAHLEDAPVHGDGAEARHREDVLVPSTALAQAWRGARGQAQLSKALQHCVIASFDALARAVGELCGRTSTRDLCDAHVAIVAASRGDVLYTSDPADMHRLVTACGRGKPVIVPC